MSLTSSMQQQRQSKCRYICILHLASHLKNDNNKHQNKRSNCLLSFHMFLASYKDVYCFFFFFVFVTDANIDERSKIDTLETIARFINNALDKRKKEFDNVNELYEFRVIQIQQSFLFPLALLCCVSAYRVESLSQSCSLFL